MVQVYSSLIGWYFKSYLTLVGIFNLVSHWLILLIISLIGWYYQSFLSLAELINPIPYYLKFSIPYLIDDIIILISYLLILYIPSYIGWYYQPYLSLVEIINSISHWWILSILYLICWYYESNLILVYITWAAVVHLNFRTGSTFPVPVCTVMPGHWVNKADTQ